MVIQGILLFLAPAWKRCTMWKDSKVVAWSFFKRRKGRVDGVGPVKFSTGRLFVLAWLSHLGEIVTTPASCRRCAHLFVRRV